ncbi:MAG: hypothetical protein HYV33_01895 [Candidatus Kerfeldbacteria bacterium]|nr:hypothetical protein [Candidatus Kerfeldbacteria bacterium]
MAQVQLPDEVYAQLEKIVQQSKEFSDVASYVSYILQQVVEKKQQTSSAQTKQDHTYSQADEDKIRERLKNLGYLD